MLHPLSCQVTETYTWKYLCRAAILVMNSSIGQDCALGELYLMGTE